MKKVLVCAPSNAAIDEVAHRIKSIGDAMRTPIKVVRIGAEKAMNANTKELSLESIVEGRLAGVGGSNDRADEFARLSAALTSVRNALKEKEKEGDMITDNTAKAKAVEEERQRLSNQRWELSKKLNALKDDNLKAGRNMDSERRKARIAVLTEADVICSTLSGAGHDMLEPLDFDLIVIDEAAQAIELSTLIPLKFKCLRCVMVGGKFQVTLSFHAIKHPSDPQQLPPTVISKEVSCDNQNICAPVLKFSKATKYRYNQSLFVRLQKQRPEAVHLLR